MIVSIIGLGLIGGSVGLILKEKGFASKVIGIDQSTGHQREAIELGLVDQCASLEEGLLVSDLVIVAIPVNSIQQLLPKVLDLVNESTVVVDLGSTKQGIAERVTNHSKRSQFVAAHPIAGTENSGPSAAFNTLFEGKTGIICDRELSSDMAYRVAKGMMEILGMHVIEMDSKSHDLHIAYVSHLSHISSFVLGQTVLEIEKDEASIFNLAGSGFESTVRLAKSSPAMWAPIFKQNKKHISDSLGAYIENLMEFKKYIDDENESEMKECMENANDIRRVLNGIENKSKRIKQLNQIT